MDLRWPDCWLLRQHWWLRRQIRARQRQSPLSLAEQRENFAPPNLPSLGVLSVVIGICILKKKLKIFIIILAFLTIIWKCTRTEYQFYCIEIKSCCCHSGSSLVTAQSHDDTHSVRSVLTHRLLSGVIYTSLLAPSNFPSPPFPSFSSQPLTFHIRITASTRKNWEFFKQIILCFGLGNLHWPNEIFKNIKYL